MVNKEIINTNPTCSYILADALEMLPQLVKTRYIEQPIREPKEIWLKVLFFNRILSDIYSIK